MTAAFPAAAPDLTSATGLPLAERLDAALQPVDAFRRLARLPHAIFFDSAMRHPQLGRYSFVAADPVEWVVRKATGFADFGLQIAELQKAISITGAGLTNCVSEAPRSDKASRRLPPFQGGWAGLFSYDLGRSWEGAPAAGIDEFATPALAIGLYDVVVAFDHQEQTAWLISQGLPESDPHARRARAAERLASFRTLINLREAAWPLRNDGSPGLPVSLSPCIDRLPPASLAPQYAVPGDGDLVSNFSSARYRGAVRRVIDYIRAGDVYQVNLSQRLLHPANTSSIELYCRLRECNPAPFAAYFDLGGAQICSASPERFLQVQSGRVETRPIKGTRPRSRSPAEDARAAASLLASSKDRAENTMIVDLLRNDLSRTCRPSSIQVSQWCGLESYASVHHLVSVIGGELRANETAWDLLRTCLPGGSVTGAPKVRAMEIISELEPTARGAYCGALAYISVGGQMDSSVLIRTITAGRGWWQLPVGGGIVAESDPEDELAETWHKAAGLLKAIG
jgi:para-aminobenzoate synthetase component 1